MPENPFLDWLDQGVGPQAGYQAFAGQGGQSSAEKKFFQNQFSKVHNQFLGTLGQQVLAGQSPSNRFGNFLQNYDFGDNYNRATPRDKGQGFGYSSRFAPQTRWFT
jgi:hypothetical protein